MRTGRREEGSGSVLAVGVIAVLVALASGAMVLLSAVHAATRARAAADLAALAAADQVLNPGTAAAPCAAAGRVAALNGARLVSCTTGAADATVEVRVRASAPGLGDAGARSRAGLPG